MKLVIINVQTVTEALCLEDGSNKESKHAQGNQANRIKY